jgi:hypothetical protein
MSENMCKKLLTVAAYGEENQENWSIVGEGV